MYCNGCFGYGDGLSSHPLAHVGEEDSREDGWKLREVGQGKGRFSSLKGIVDSVCPQLGEEQLNDVAIYCNIG